MPKCKSNILVTICARGNSKGLPGKHLKEINGKPLIAWTIEQAVTWGKGFIVLSSDDKNILNVGLGYDAPMQLQRRSKKLAQDNTPKLDVLRSALKSAERSEKKQFDIIIDLDATNPMRTVEDIEGCYRLFLRKKPNTVVSVVKSRKSPYFNMVEVRDGQVGMCKQASAGAYRRQDVPYTYDLNASIYVYKREWLLDKGNKSPITKNTELCVMPDHTFCDIDTELDFKIVEKLMTVTGKILT